MVPDGMSKAFSALNLTSQGLDVFKMLLVDLTSRAQKKSNRQYALVFEVRLEIPGLSIRAGAEVGDDGIADTVGD